MIQNPNSILSTPPPNQSPSMDLSKLPDSQRQQLEQLQKQFQEHQAQQKKQQEESAAAAAAATVAVQQQPPPAAYDPSQVHQSYDPSQTYDQSYYYNYNYQDPSQQQQQQQPQPQPQQYDASYYQNYYPNAYQQQPQQHQFTHPETSAATAYTVPSEQQRNEGSVSSGLGHVQVQVQDPYVDPSNQVNLGGTQPNPGYPVPPGLNAAAAAAVAALSQLTQFAGTMGAAERAIGGGGYGPPMSGGGHYGQGPFRPPVGHSPYRGGGRRGGGSFRGGGRGFRPPSSGGSGPPFHGRGRGRGRGRGGGRHDQPSSSHPEASAVEAAKPSEGSESSAQPNDQPPIRIAWCELCRVDCNSKEILEQHKSGKRHQKNLHNSMKGVHQPAPETQKDENAPTDIKVGTTTDDNKVETVENDGQEKKPFMKRKIRGGGRGGGRGGAKRQRQGGASGPPKPKIVIPLMCDLCNVKCDTQEVFDRHVAGKKHVAKLKRFEGHQAMYGPTAVQALYPPNPLSQSLGGPQPAYYGAPPAPDAYIAPPHQTENPNPQLADAPLEFSNTQNNAAANEPQAAGNGV